ncbi:MAG: ATP/GTP-binding protein [Acidimicrobiia bacterium]
MPEWRGTTVQVCGLWPFIAGTGSPMVGVPLGRHLTTRATVCCDPISWFQPAGLIPNASLMVVGHPGLGKSSLVRRMVLGLSGFGVSPLVLGDLKGEYRDLIEALGGAVLELGPGRGAVNPLDPGAAASAAGRLVGPARAELLEKTPNRRKNMLVTLLAMNRGSRPTDHEEAVLHAALGVLDDTFAPGQATLPDLLAVLAEGPDRVRQVTLDRGNDRRYRAAVDPLQRSLAALIEGGLGRTFARRTTTPIRLDRPLAIDISAINEADTLLQAAVLLACWAEGFAALEALQALTDAGLEPQRNYFVVLDELWRVLRAGTGMIDRIDELTRLDRQKGVGTVLVTHTLRDLLAVAEADRPKAEGFAGRMGMHAFVGAPPSELHAIREIVALSDKEAAMITSWSSPPTWAPASTSASGGPPPPPGLGKVLLKVGGRPGIPVQLDLVAAELELHDTNRRWR